MDTVAKCRGWVEVGGRRVWVNVVGKKSLKKEMVECKKKKRNKEIKKTLYVADEELSMPELLPRNKRNRHKIIRATCRKYGTVLTR